MNQWFRKAISFSPSAKRSVAGILAGVIFLLTWLVFLCPMQGVSPRQMSASSVSTLCAEEQTAKAPLLFSQNFCLDFHLGMVQKLTNAWEGASMALILFMGLILLSSVTRLNRIFPSSLKQIPQRFRHFAFFYITKVRVLCEEKRIAWWSLIESHSRVSIGLLRFSQV